VVTVGSTLFPRLVRTNPTRFVLKRDISSGSIRSGIVNRGNFTPYAP